MQKVKVGIIGCGQISETYLKNCTERLDILEVVACSDIVLERAQAKAKEFNIPKACSVEDLLADPEIKIVVNLTNPQYHMEVSMAILSAGKNVYTEKPLTTEREDAKKVLAFAKSKGLLVGGAPDTFLGAGLQTCRKLIDDGWIGKPLFANAMIAMCGAEHEGYCRRGVGPMYDMGPYYVTALVSLLGPVIRVSGSTKIPFEEKEIIDVNSPKAGQKFKVETPTVVSGIMDFANGAIGNITTTIECFSYMPRLEIYGSEGMIVANDPNMFSDPIFLQTRCSEKKEIPYSHGFIDECRGVGLADMAYALITGRKHRANGELTYHVLDVMHAFHDASEKGKYVNLESTCERPEPFISGFTKNVLSI